MSLQVGDKVSFINEALDGVVSKIIDKKSVEVTTSDGFGIPVLIAELVKTGGVPNEANKPIGKTTGETSSNIIPTRANLKKKPYLCFAKEEKVKNLYILNNSGFSTFYSLRIQKGGEWVLIYSGKVNKNSFVFVSAYEDRELDAFGKVLIEALNVEFSIKEKDLPTSTEVKIKSSKFFKESSYVEIPIIEKLALLVDISGETIEDVPVQEELRKSVESMATIKPLKGLKVIGKIDLKQEKRNRNRGEIDLHIEKLGVSFKGKTNAEIVQLQLNAAKQYIDKSMLAGKKEIVLVHGVGNGTLKQEVQKLLKSYYGIKFEQADARNYGDGATLVHLKG